ICSLLLDRFNPAMPTTLATERRVTITEIAAACGVSRATVSLVLRDSPLVRDETRSRVQAELARQNYVYHRGAANLRRRASNAVALVLNDLSNPYFAELAGGPVVMRAEARTVSLLGRTGEPPQRLQAVPAPMIRHVTAAITLTPAEHSSHERLRQVPARATPPVLNPAIGEGGAGRK